MLKIIFILGTLAWPGVPARAEESAVKASLVSEAREVVAGRPFRVAVRLAMDKGWHTYSDPPGEAGMPTEVLWELPPGFTAGRILWPGPKKFDEGGVVSLGYDGTVDLKADIRPPRRLEGKAVTLKAKVRWLECREICRPGSADLRLSLPVRRPGT